MAYVPPSGGNIVVEISTAQGYVPPSATAINVDLAVEEGGGSGETSFISSNGALTLAPESIIKAVIAHSLPVAALSLTAYAPTYAVTTTSAISSAGTLTLAAQSPTYSASSTVGNGALTLTPQQPVYFMGYTQPIAEQGALFLTAGGVEKATAANQITTAGMLLSGQEPTYSATTAIASEGALTLTGLAPVGQKTLVHSDIESTYFYPDVTLDSAGELTLTAYPPTERLHLYAYIEGFCGLMERVAAEVVGTYTARVVAEVEAPFTVLGSVAVGVDSEYKLSATDRVVKAIDSPYRLPIVSAYESIFSMIENVTVRAEVSASYSVIQTQVVRNGVEAAYSGLTNTPVRNSVEGEYSYQSMVFSGIECSFSLTVPLCKDFEAPYTLEPIAKVRVPIDSFYSAPLAQVISIVEPPYVEYMGRRLEVEEAELTASEGDSTWTCSIVLSRISDYAQLKWDQPFAVVFGAERYEFLVDGKELDRSSPANFGMRLMGISPSARYSSPRMVSSSYVWDTVVSAAQIADELIPGIDWRVIDWNIPAYRFSIQDATPLESVRALAEAIGATLESEIDGSLYVRSLYPVSTEKYAETTPAHILTEAVDILTVNESYVSSEVFNRLVITDIEQEISDSLEWLEDYTDATTGIIRAYLYPWRSAVDLIHTGVGTVTIENPVTGMEQHEEIIEVFQGQADTSYPIHHVESVEYEAQNVGGIVFDVDSRSFTVGGPSFNSVIRLVYWTRSLDYRVALPDARPTQFLLESDPL